MDHPTVFVVQNGKSRVNVWLTGSREDAPAKDQIWFHNTPQVPPFVCFSSAIVGPPDHFPLPR